MTTRIAIVDASKCKPAKCGLECRKKCPVVFMGKECIDVSKTSKIAFISEQLCNGCNNCTKSCPFGAVTIVRLPGANGDNLHRYGPNSFMLKTIPNMNPGSILGLVGANGVGKSTVLKVLAGKLIPNLGIFADPKAARATDQAARGKGPAGAPAADIVRLFRGSEMHQYLTRLYGLASNAGTLKVSVKPQYVDQIATIYPGTTTVSEALGAIIDPASENMATAVAALSLEALLPKTVKTLSGGELQRFAIACSVLKTADVYMFDELTSFLDVKQRICAARLIQSMVRKPSTYVLAIEHDLSILDYLSDQICCQYGAPSVYGITSQPIGTRDGINQFIDGYLPGENVRFRTETLDFRQSAVTLPPPTPTQAVTATSTVAEESVDHYSYNAFNQTLGLDVPGGPTFELASAAGSIRRGTVTVILGENGMGKTTLLKQIATSRLSVSCKPQLIRAAFKGTVRALVMAKIGAAMVDPVFQSTVVRPLNLAALYDLDVQSLSGGEIQTVAICMALGKPADVYMLDEPSAYLDSEQRIAVARAIKSFVVHFDKAAFVVEHDMLMATTIATQVIVFRGTPGVRGEASAPMPLVQGMNLFLQSIGTTFRTDSITGRPRINKSGSTLDKEQQAANTYFR